MEPNEQNNQVLAPKKAIDDLPNGLVVNYGGTKMDNKEEGISAIRSYIRGQVLRMYGVMGMNHATISQLPLGFGANAVQTKLRLPKPVLNANGTIGEAVATYYERVLPTIKTWFGNCMFNSQLSEAIVTAME